MFQMWDDQSSPFRQQLGRFAGEVPLTHRGFSTNHLHFCVGQSKAKSLPAAWRSSSPGRRRPLGNFVTLYWMNMLRIHQITRIQEDQKIVRYFPDELHVYVSLV
jgi:hypothetical protein